MLFCSYNEEEKQTIVINNIHLWLHCGLGKIYLKIMYTVSWTTERNGVCVYYNHQDLQKHYILHLRFNNDNATVVYQ